MDKLLFRGQTRKKGEKVHMPTGTPCPGIWVYGGVLMGAGDHSIIYGGPAGSKGIDKWPVHTDTLGQYIGRADKNGEKIFTGDIVRVDIPGREQDLFVVFLDVHNSRFAMRNTNPAHGEYSLPFERSQGGVPGANDLHNIFEVVGNIHDNPELL